MSVAKEIAMLDISGSLDEDGRCMGDILSHFSWIKKTFTGGFLKWCRIIKIFMMSNSFC